jgi:anti-sigma factor RsiW
MMSLPTDCWHIQPLLTPLLTGELEVAARRAVQLHVTVCPACCDELRRVRLVHHLLRASARSQGPASARRIPDTPSGTPNDVGPQPAPTPARRWGRRACAHRWPRHGG